MATLEKVFLEIKAADLERLPEKCQEVAIIVLNAVFEHQLLEIDLEPNLAANIKNQQDILIYYSLLDHLEHFVNLGYIQLNAPGTEQRSGKFPGFWKDTYQQKLTEREAAIDDGKRAPLVVQKGSSGAFSPLLRRQYEHRDQVLDTLVSLEDNVDYLNLNNGASGNQWGKYYDPVQKLDEATKLQVLRELIDFEEVQVGVSDLIVAPIYKECLSLFATIELLFIAASAMLNGQKLITYIEEFDSALYVKTKVFDYLTKKRQLAINTDSNYNDIVAKVAELAQTEASINLPGAESFIQNLFQMQSDQDVNSMQRNSGGLIPAEEIESLITQAANASSMRQRVKQFLADVSVLGADPIVKTFDNWDNFGQTVSQNLIELAGKFAQRQKMSFPEQLPVPEIKAGISNATSDAIKPAGYPDRDSETVSEYEAEVLKTAKWADNPQIDAELKSVIEARAQTYHPQGLKFDNQNRPINPLGETKVSGRGELGKWGINSAADPIITRIDPVSGMLQLLAIKRAKGGQWAIPGGMVDPGEALSAAAGRELKEETGVEISPEEFKRRATSVYQGPVDDPRNTNNAWMVTSAFHYHIEPDEIQPKPEAGDDASASDWVTITPELLHGLVSNEDNSLYANHEEFVQKALVMFYNSRQPNLSDKIKRQILGVIAA